MQPLTRKPIPVLELARNKLRNKDATELQMTPQPGPSKQERDVAHENGGTDQTMEARRLKVLALLQSNPESARVVIADSESNPNSIILTIALRDVATFEMLVDRAKFDPMEFMALAGKQDPNTVVQKDGVSF
jgi:hypothetical protein